VRVVLLIALLVGLAPTAGALATPTPSSARAGYFTTEAGERVLDGRRVAALARTGLAASFGSRCKRVWAARVYRNIYGSVVWKYFQQQGFCYDGVRVTSLFDWRRWPEQYSPAWQFKGHLARSRTGWAGRWHYGTWTQGKFALCLAWCIFAQYPWVDLDVYGNGAWTHKTGGT
jgi:hypothetical protein